eukprot:CAMPEP_0194108338 /NCGR_PEP_ID=MMETSP0150-20130528/8072_1 /TAXON_ID=122233 /ORGANISM="Chaetoceros debilis, Strain MM31A-1" /LENGTH=53 /DNA_ID=CAMNT_0038797027 /DNA_START=1 /DNA_END=159 /DNA_ORIENTATION=+
MSKLSESVSVGVGGNIGTNGCGSHEFAAFGVVGSGGFGEGGGWVERELMVFVW